MTAQTQSQRNASYRQRQRDKIARYEGALREIAGCEAYEAEHMIDVARKALR